MDIAVHLASLTLSVCVCMRSLGSWERHISICRRKSATRVATGSICSRLVGWAALGDNDPRDQSLLSVVFSRTSRIISRWPQRPCLSPMRRVRPETCNEQRLATISALDILLMRTWAMQIQILTRTWNISVLRSWETVNLTIAMPKIARPIVSSIWLIKNIKP